MVYNTEVTFLVNKNARGRMRTAAEPNFKHQVFLGVFRLLIIIFFGVLVWYVTRLQFFTITNVTVAGGETISHEEMQIQLMDELKGTYFLVIPKRFTYLYPHERMMEVLQKNPRLHNVHIARTRRTSLGVSFEEYVPYGLWCIAGREPAFCYLLTREGYAFVEAPALTGGTLVRHMVEGVEEIAQGTVIDAVTLGAIDTFIARAETELGFRITSLVHTKDGDIQFMINGGGSIFVAKGKDFSETFENVKLVLASKEFTHIKPGNFKYIDARFSNKIFVNEEITVEEPVATTTSEVAELPE